VLAEELGWEPTGVELNEFAIMLAKSWAHLPVLAGDVSDKALFPPASYDLVTLWGVVEHCPHPDVLLRACAEIVRPGGYIALETPNTQGLFRDLAYRVATRFPAFQRPFHEMLGSGHVAWYSASSIRATAEGIGLDVLHIKGSRNATGILTYRFRRLALAPRLFFQAGTAILNLLAVPLGRPNQLLACFQRPSVPTHGSAESRQPPLHVSN